MLDPYGNKFEITDPDIRMQLGEPFQGTFRSVVGFAFSVQFLLQEFGYIYSRIFARRKASSIKLRIRHIPELGHGDGQKRAKQHFKLTRMSSALLYSHLVESG